MREKNTNEPRTNFCPNRPQKLSLLLSAVLLSSLAGGCVSTDPSTGDAWKKTKTIVQSTYAKTRHSIANTLTAIAKYQSDSAREQQIRQEKNPSDGKNKKRKTIARPAATPRFQDRFPSKTHRSQEKALKSDKGRRAAGRNKRGEDSKEELLVLSTAMTSEELRQRIHDIEQERIRSKSPVRRRKLTHEQRKWEQMLLRSQKEENIINEMTKLRHRLRKLQRDLLKIQQTNR